jgi:diacylglycerol kinase (ATP)
LGSTKFKFSLDQARFAHSTPLLCFVNPRSGEQATSLIFSTLYRSLNPLQILDLSTHKPGVLLKTFLPFLDTCRILVCGGDGTIAWVLNALDSLKLDKPHPPVGLIPLGTGNDLARVLGWGGGYRGEPVLPRFAVFFCATNSETVAMLALS